MVNSLKKDGIFSVIITIISAFIVLSLVSINVNNFGIENWNRYQYFYILLIGSFNLNFGLPYAANYFGSKDSIGLFQILLYSFAPTALTASLYTVYFAFTLEIFEPTSLVLILLLVFAFNYIIILRNYLEGRKSVLLGVGIKSITLISIVCIPFFLSEEFNMIALLKWLCVILISSLIIMISFMNWNKGENNIDLSGFFKYSLSSLKASLPLHIFNVLLLVIFENKLTAYAYGIFLLLYEIGSKLAIVTNVFNTIAAPRMSKGQLDVKFGLVLRYLIPIVLLIIITTPAYAWLFELYSGYLIEGWQATVILVYFLITGLNTVLLRLLIATDKMRVYRLLWIINISGLIMLWLLESSFIALTTALLSYAVASFLVLSIFYQYREKAKMIL